MNLIFEPDPLDIDRRLRDEDALDVLVIDDPRMPTAIHVETNVLEDAVRGRDPDHAVSERDALRRGADDWARTLQFGRPDIAYVPNATTYARVQLAIGLAARDIRVVVGTSREAFLAVADDPALRDKLWT